MVHCSSFGLYNMSQILPSALLEERNKMKTLAQRRQSAPSLVISKALTRSKSTSRESCLTLVSPGSCSLVQAFLAECPRRLFLGHAQTQLKMGLQTQERHLFLFTDALLVAKAKSPTHFKVKAQVRVCEMWTASCIEEVCEGSTNPERSFVMGWPSCNYVATFSRIIEGKEKDDPKTIPLKIFAKDIGNSAYVRFSSFLLNLLNLILIFSVQGCVKDHRLWVNSSKDDPPYPLIGHEFPFSIKMSHIRDGGSSGGGLGGGAGRDPTSPTDCPGVLLLDQCLPPDTQCQFILKPSKIAPGQTPLIEPGQQKYFKRKRSLINWPFWRGSNTQLDGLPLSPTSLSPTQGRLFGRPLSSVCSPDHGLPKPVMDMLVFLYLEGPYTRGIFRRSAGAKACRELRDRLDSGTEDPEITHQSVFVIAAVLKDFLRNIPGSMLCVDLYEQWMDVMEGEGGEEWMQAVQRLLHLLPSENLLLLRHVIAVLHCIRGNAHDNQMNAFNLSVCIAPSMLWAPAPSTPEMEGEGTKKVCELIRLLIENCSSVLGEDVTSLFRSFSQKSSCSDHGSDVSSFQMNDSSYDSLENELNDDPESPFQEQLPLRNKDKPDSRSRDSVITLSDCDPDLDPENDLILQLPPLARPRRFSPAVRQPRTRQANGLTQGPRRLRRSSEPALAVASTPPLGTVTVHADNHHLPVRKASYDAAMEGERVVDEVFLEHGLSGLQLKEEEEDRCEKGGAKVQNGGRRKMKHAPPPPLRLDASCSSLSSPATSPTGSSLSSLDSAFSQYSTDYPTNGAISLAEPAPLLPRYSPPQREVPPHWPQPIQAPRTSETPPHPHGLHPNTWLKKSRRLSLKQADNGRSEEDLPVVNGKIHPTSNGCSVETSDGQRAEAAQQPDPHLQTPRSQPPLTVPNHKQEVRSHRGWLEMSAYSPHRGHKGQRTLPRRASEPSEVTANSNPSSSLTLDRPRTSEGQPQDGGLRVSEVEPNHAKPRFCLSPSATRAVRDYFSSQSQEDADVCLRRSQEVALAIVQGKREWQSRQCSDPRVDDFDQLFFAEESYV
uniref:Rho GTPase-activating protein 20 n=1 Tax=Sander lucioperca TaxID=283035 RepID=A0A8C9Y6V2_SANLU